MFCFSDSIKSVFCGMIAFLLICEVFVKLSFFPQLPSCPRPIAQLGSGMWSVAAKVANAVRHPIDTLYAFFQWLRGDKGLEPARVTVVEQSDAVVPSPASPVPSGDPLLSPARVSASKPKSHGKSNQQAVERQTLAVLATKAKADQQKAAVAAELSKEPARPSYASIAASPKK